MAGSKPASGSAAPPGAEVEALLRQPDCVAQYSVVRAAHQALAEHGETTEWLGVLVRGYANLALLTRHYWNAVPEVFTARAWLYAQRFAAKTNSSDMALWHRAYAWAWCGTLPLAAADLDEVERRRNPPGVTSTQTSTASAPPSWVKLTRAYSQFDRSAIQQVMDEDSALKPWGAVLRYTLSSFTHHERWILGDARQIAEICPTAYMVFGELAGHGSYQDLQVPEAMSATLFFSRGVPQAVAAIPALPDSVKALTVRQAPPAESSSAPTPSGLSLDAFSPLPMELARQLRAESAENVLGEPSWSCLAYLVEEEQFLQVLHYVATVRKAATRPLANDVERLLPLVKNHRYAAYVAGYRYDFQTQASEVEGVWKTIKVVDPRAGMFFMLYGLRLIGALAGADRGRDAYGRGYTDLTLHAVTEHLWTLESMETLDSQYLSQKLIAQARDVAPQSDRAAHSRHVGGQEPQRRETCGMGKPAPGEPDGLE